MFSPEEQGLYSLQTLKLMLSFLSFLGDLSYFTMPELWRHPPPFITGKKVACETTLGLFLFVLIRINCEFVCARVAD